MPQDSEQIILALETAVGGGSISVFQNDAEIASICGEAGISRAESLITIIDQLLNSCGVSFRDISTIAVSTGPGSYTGIRIGMSTAMGLAGSLGSAFIGVDLLTAMCESVQSESAVVSAVPIGRYEVAWETYDNIEDGRGGDPQIGTISDFVSVVLDGQYSVAILYRSLYKAISNLNIEFPATLKIIDAGENLSTFIGRSANQKRGSQNINPIYLLNPARRRGLF
jgi:tRNA threonylcarbamoyl adenosine modification protein YeaZ